MFYLYLPKNKDAGVLYFDLLLSQFDFPLCKIQYVATDEFKEYNFFSYFLSKYT